MAFDTGLAQRIREVLAQRPGLIGITEKKMFGGLAFMVNGYMFVGIVRDALMARVGPDHYERALATRHVRPMDFTGRPMKGYVYVDPEGIDDDSELAAWVGQCLDFVNRLPPKTAPQRLRPAKR